MKKALPKGSAFFIGSGDRELRAVIFKRAEILRTGNSRRYSQTA
jgi:hypothetical protein